MHTLFKMRVPNFTLIFFQKLEKKKRVMLKKIIIIIIIKSVRLYIGDVTRVNHKTTVGYSLFM